MHADLEPVLTWQGKISVLGEYARRFPLPVMIETGLWQGNGSGMHLRFPRYVVIDKNPAYCELARTNHPQAEVYCGDSGTVLARVLEHEPGPAFFWLDAHDVEEIDGTPDCPLLAELDAILAWPHAARSVVLIDDVRYFGEPGWPALTEVLLKVQGDLWHVGMTEDILRCVPKGEL